MIYYIISFIPGLQKDRDCWTGGPKEGLCSTGRFGIKYKMLIKYKFSFKEIASEKSY